MAKRRKRSPLDLPPNKRPAPPAGEIQPTPQPPPTGRPPGNTLPTSFPPVTPPTGGLPPGPGPLPTSYPGPSPADLPPIGPLPVAPPLPAAGPAGQTTSAGPTQPAEIGPPVQQPTPSGYPAEDQHLQPVSQATAPPETPPAASQGDYVPMFDVGFAPETAQSLDSVLLAVDEAVQSVADAVDARVQMAIAQSQTHVMATSAHVQTGLSQLVGAPAGAVQDVSQQVELQLGGHLASAAEAAGAGSGPPESQPKILTGPPAGSGGGFDPLEALRKTLGYQEPWCNLGGSGVGYSDVIQLAASNGDGIVVQYDHNLHTNDPNNPSDAWFWQQPVNTGVGAAYVQQVNSATGQIGDKWTATVKPGQYAGNLPTVDITGAACFQSVSPSPAPSPQPPPKPDPLQCLCDILDEMRRSQPKPPEPQPPDQCGSLTLGLSFNPRTCEVAIKCGQEYDDLPAEQKLGDTIDFDSLDKRLKACLDKGTKPPVTPQPIGVGDVQVEGITDCPVLPYGELWEDWGNPYTIAATYGLTDREGNIQTYGLGGLVGTLGAVLLKAVIAVPAKVLSQVVVVTKRITGNLPCSSDEFGALAVSRMVTGFISRWIGGGLDDVDDATRAQQRNLCPLGIPTLDQTIGMWLNRTIDDATFACWARANNLNEVYAKQMAFGGRSKLTPPALVQLYLRGELGRGELQQALREQGWVNPGDTVDWLTVTQQIPPISDLTRMMVRDVADNNIASKYGYDQDFEAKFSGQLKDFATWQNIHPDYAKLYWRAHWQLPSPSQLYEMAHRLNGPDTPADVKTSLDDVLTALKVNDYPEYWAKRLMAISYRLPRYRDLSRGYEIGAINSDGLRQAFKEYGYSQQNSEILVEFWVKQTLAKRKRSPLLKAAARGELSWQEVSDQFKQDGATEAEISQLHDWMLTLARSYRRKACLASIKRKFAHGEIDDTQLDTELQTLDLSPTQTQELAAQLRCQKTTRSRDVPASTLCDLYQRGLLSAAEYYTRLVNLGYESDDANLLAQRCRTIQDERLAKAEAKKLLQKKREKEREIKQAKQSAAALHRQQQAAARARESRQRRIDAVRKLLAQAAVALCSKTDSDPASCVDAVSGIMQTYAGQGGYTDGQVAEALTVALKFADVKDVATLSTAVGSVLRQEITYVHPDDTQLMV